MEIQMEGGEVVVLEEPEALYTYRAWKQRGRQVKKGEKAVAQFPIWKQGKAKTIKADDGTEEEQPGRMFMKLSSFFKLDQTEPIKA